MKSELWQRLRAVRDYADIKQDDLARACGKSRSLVAQWESKIPANRTVPSISDIKEISRLCKVPVDWILNDNSDPADVWRIGAMSAPTATVESKDRQPSETGRMVASAVKFEVMQRAPDLVKNFLRSVFLPGTGISVVAEYTDHSRVVSFATSKDYVDVTGRMLLLSKATGKTPVLIIISIDGVAEVPDIGIKTHVVRTAAEAAEILINT